MVTLPCEHNNPRFLNPNWSSMAAPRQLDTISLIWGGHNSQRFDWVDTLESNGGRLSYKPTLLAFWGEKGWLNMILIQTYNIQHETIIESNDDMKCTLANMIFSTRYSLLTTNILRNSQLTQHSILSQRYGLLYLVVVYQEVILNQKEGSLSWEGVFIKDSPKEGFFSHAVFIKGTQERNLFPCIIDQVAMRDQLKRSLFLILKLIC